MSEAESREFENCLSVEGRGEREHDSDSKCVWENTDRMKTKKKAKKKHRNRFEWELEQMGSILYVDDFVLQH